MRRSLQILYQSLLLAAVASMAFGQGEQARNECSEKGSQADMRSCLEDKAKSSHAALLRAQDRAREALDKWDEDKAYVAKAKQSLKASSAQFERYRQEQCDFQKSLAGGAAGNAVEMRRLGCMSELNARRAADLDKASARLPRK